MGFYEEEERKVLNTPLFTLILSPASFDLFARENSNASPRHPRSVEVPQKASAIAKAHSNELFPKGPSIVEDFENVGRPLVDRSIPYLR